VNTREVDQTRINVLYLDAQFLESFDFCYQLLAKFPRPLRAQLGHLVDWPRSVGPGAIALPMLAKQPGWGTGGQKLGPEVDHQLNALSDVGKSLLSLLKREMLHRPVSPAWIQGVSTRSILATLSGALGLLTLTACGERGEALGTLPLDLPVAVQGAAAEPFVGETLPTRVVALDDATRRIAGREPVRVFIDTGFRLLSASTYL